MQSPRPEEPGTLALLSCCLSAHRRSLLGHPVPARELGHRCLRLTGGAWRRLRTLTGFPRSACASCDRGGRPLDPEASGVHTTGEDSPAAARRSSTARPCTPVFIPSPGALGNEASAGVHSRSPVRSSPRLRSRMERVRFGFFPELRTPQLPAAHVRAGTGLEHWPGATSPASRRSSDPQAHSQHATSCRTSSAQSSPTDKRIRSPVQDAENLAAACGRTISDLMRQCSRPAGGHDIPAAVNSPGCRQGHDLFTGLQVQGKKVLTCRRPPGTESAVCGPGRSH